MIIKVRMENINEQIVLRADSTTQKVLLNGDVVEYDVGKFISDVLEMTCNWPSELFDQTICDGVTYSIVIKDGDNKKCFVFKNKFPNDIYKLNGLIFEVKYGGKVL